MPFHIFERLFSIFQMSIWNHDKVCESFRQMGTDGVTVKNIVEKMGKE